MLLIEPKQSYLSTNWSLTEGESYVVSQDVAARLLSKVPAIIRDLRNHLGHPDDASTFNSTSRVLVSLDGPYGDLLFAGPALLKLKESVASVTVACLKRYWPILEHLGLDYIPVPISLDEVANYDHHCWLNGALVHGELPRTTHAVDVFAKALKVSLLDREKRCHYVLQNGERRWADSMWPRSVRPRIGIAPTASVLSRTMPAVWWTQFFNLVLQRGWEVFIVGQSGDLSVPDIPYLRNMTHPRVGYSFRQSVAVLTTCDVVVGMDSALLHVAGALDLPAIGLFSTHPPALRSSYHTSVVTLQAPGECAPCFHRGGEWPEHGPCAETKRCEALHNIDHTKVLEHIEDLLT